MQPTFSFSAIATILALPLFTNAWVFEFSGVFIKGEGARPCTIAYCAVGQNVTFTVGDKDPVLELNIYSDKECRNEITHTPHDWEGKLTATMQSMKVLT